MKVRAKVQITVRVKGRVSVKVKVRIQIRVRVRVWVADAINVGTRLVIDRKLWFMML